MGKRKRKRARRNSWYFLKTISVAGTTLKYGHLGLFRIAQVRPRAENAERESIRRKPGR